MAGSFILTSGTASVQTAKVLNGVAFHTELVPVPHELQVTLASSTTKVFPVSAEVASWLTSNPGAVITGSGVGIREDYLGHVSKMTFVEFNSADYFQIPTGLYEFLTGHTYNDANPPTGVLPVLM